MKNRILYLIVFAIAVLGLSSCDDESTAGFTDITYYPTLELLGDASVIVPIGSTFEDPGYVSKLEGVDVSDQVVINSNVDTSTGGVYTVNYAITNADGFDVTASRTVYVADVTPSVIATGMHTVVSGTHRVNQNSGATTPYSGYDVLILQIEPGIFYISDFLGGYYDQRAGYGSNYAMTGYFQLNSDNTLTMVSSYVSGWGDSADDFYTATVNPTTGAISWSVLYAGYLEFNVIMN